MITAEAQVLRKNRELGFRPEGPAVNRPDRKVGKTKRTKMSAEGAAHPIIAGALCRECDEHVLQIKIALSHLFCLSA
jgi:hypothetical protein